jgi:hypothetical protein
VTLGYGTPEWLRFLPVDFEAGAFWWDQLAGAGFDPGQPAVIASTGASMYLTKPRHDCDPALHRRARRRDDAGDDVMVPLDMIDPADRAGVNAAADGAGRSGTPWVSFYGRDACPRP